MNTYATNPDAFALCKCGRDARAKIVTHACEDCLPLAIQKAEMLEKELVEMREKLSKAFSHITLITWY